MNVPLQGKPVGGFCMDCGSPCSRLQTEIRARSGAKERE